MSTTTEKLGLTKVVQADTMATWMTAHNSNADILDGVLGLVYPVGSIYMSVNNTSPATLFGGTWEAIGGKFLIGADSSHAAGTTGGSETKSIAETNLPSHSHSLNSHKHSIGAHYHGLNNHKHSIGAHSHGLNSHVHSVGAHSHGLNSHTHSVGAHYHGLNNHTHSLNSHTHTFSAGTNNDSIYVPNEKAGFWVSNATGGTQWAVFSYGTSASGKSADLYISGTTGAATGNTGAASGNTANSAAFNTGAASGSTANSSAFNTGAASGSTANSTAFDSGAASGNTANSTAFDSGAATGNTGATGGGTALNIMPPYLSVYMWKRTA